MRLRILKQISGMAGVTVRDRMQYRLNFFMTLIATLTYSALYYMIWRAVYRYSPQQALPWQQLITYVMIGQTINFTRFSPAERSPIYRMEDRIQSGDVALDLIRPVDFQWQRFAEAVGFFLVELVWVVLPSFALLLLVLRISPPKNGVAVLGFIASLFIAFLVSFSLNSILMMLNFWTVNAQGLHKAKKALVEILAGTLIPFEFFPLWFKGLVQHLPFQSLAYLPLSIYTGKIGGTAIPLVLLEQLAWAALTFVISRLLWSLAARRITIYGG